jgi:SPP1 family predicted phage head-tail adaptor
MSAIGTLDRRLILEAPVETPDGAGGVTRSYTPATTLWAQLVPASVRAEVVAGAAGATVTHRITIRARDDVTTRHRLREGNRVFRILNLRDRDGEGRFLEISAEERVE